MCVCVPDLCVTTAKIFMWEIREHLGAEIEEITVPCDGMIFSLREYPAVCEGELLARICKTERPAGKYE